MCADRYFDVQRRQAVVVAGGKIGTQNLELQLRINDSK
jgi:hypothetical protein